MWAAALVVLAVSAEPQCPTDRTSCITSNIGKVTYDYKGGNNDQMCNSRTWMTFDYCYTQGCPMKLVITEPPELRTWMCVWDNKFEPYSPDAHIDLYHPLNNQVLEVEAVGDVAVGSTRKGCRTGDYDVGSKTFAGKIVLARRGSCKYVTKSARAQDAGAAMLVVVDSWWFHKPRRMAGSINGIENFPALYTTRAEGDKVLAALDKGVKVKGKFQYECKPMPEGFLDNTQDYPWDRCPLNRIALEGTCNAPNSTQEPLCVACAVELQLPGAEKLCLRGNDLRPRTKETLMHTSQLWELPYTSQTDEVVYATELADKGCSVSDYAGLAGRILLMRQASGCTLVQTVRNAQAAGVKAYVLVSNTYFLKYHPIRAYSHNITIPVHALDYHAIPKLQLFVEAGGGRHVPGAGYALDAMTFSRGEVPPTDAPTPGPAEAVVVDTRPQPDTSGDFDLSGGVAVCLAVVCVDAVLIAVVFAKQRREAVRLPDEVGLSSFTIPLKVASMGLSLTLLLLIAVVTFALATVAGQDSTDEAMENGRAALALSHASSAANTIELSDTIRENTIDRVLGLLQSEVLLREYRLKLVEDMLADFDGSWQQFDDLFLMVFRMTTSSDRNVDSVRFHLFTTRGFFMAGRYKTDDRPDEIRQDGVVGTVAETQEGWRYGVNYYDPDYVNRRGVYKLTKSVAYYNASRMLAGNIGDPLAVTRGKPARHTTWMAGRLKFPVGFTTLLPMSAFRPILSLNGEYLGTVEVRSSLEYFIDSVLRSTHNTGNLQNMTVLVVDTTDKAILGACGVEDWKTEAHAQFTTLESLRGLYYMHSHPNIGVTALAHYLDSKDGWTEHAGEFDQKDHFKEQPYLTLAKVTASGGKVVNLGDEKSGVEMRDGACGECVVFDAQLQKEVLLFDGATTLHLYRNLTRDAPVVVKSQVNSPGEPWRSRYESFNETLTYPDGTECVARTYRDTSVPEFKKCILLRDVSRFDNFIVSMRIRPDEVYAETSPSATTPRLFSDSLVGDANIRLFANGQLYLFVLKYGCRTEPFVGGFPVGVWTTVTASIGEGLCRVYVNGTLHSSAADARGTTRLHTNPYRSGQFFKGRMDSVQIIRYHMTAGEVASLHHKDRLVRDVMRRRFFTQTKTLDLNEDQLREGVRWTVAVLIPRDDIMRVVDTKRRETLQDVQVQEDNTHKKLAQRANATIMVIVAIAMTSVVVFLVFNNMLTQPVSKFAQEILRVSQVDIEGIATSAGGVSFLREIHVMQCAMNTLVKNMREYKTFMPEAIFALEQSVADTHTQAQDAPGLSTGRAAVLFTDVQGSTRLWESCTEAMAEALRLHNTVIRKLIAECGGYEVKTIGSHASSAANTIELSDTIRENTIDRVLGLLQKEVLHREYRLKMVEDMLADFDGSWQQFEDLFLMLFRMTIRSDQKVDVVRVQIFTTRGFFMNGVYKTDDRPDEIRQDGVVGTVAETQEGWRYGVNYYDSDFINRRAVYKATTSVVYYNASRMLAGNIGDPLAVTRGKPARHTTWMAGRLKFPMKFNSLLPMSAFRPILGLNGEYLGTVEVRSSLEDFINTALETTRNTGNLQNMTVLVVDTTDKAILGARGVVDWKTEAYAQFTIQILLRGLYYMHSHPDIGVTALAHYLDSKDGWTEHAGEFDQKDHFKEQPYLTLAKVTASGGKVVNLGDEKSGVEMRDGACGECVVFDAQLQKEVLLFDGATTLHLYRNLTRDAPVVVKSQVNSPGEPWRSRYESFNETLTYPDGTECVARTYRLTPATEFKKCILLRDVSRFDNFIVSMRIRPDEVYAETSPSATTPRLFSDSLVGDANIRLFANGQLYLFVLKYGCRTEPFVGGFPVGVWTTVTASIGEGLCRVYVNGTLHSSAADARGTTRLHTNPYRSGQFFKGRMDSVQIIRYHMTAGEVASLHHKDRLVRDVTQRRFFTQTKTLDLNEDQLREGVRWTVAVLIPRDDIMRVVDTKRRETLQDVQVQEDNTHKKLAQRANATIMVIVAIAMTSVVVFLVFNDMLTRPFEETAAIMAEAAVLRIDSIPQGSSMITELGAMHKAMVLMLVNLKLYKSFMPQSVQLEATASEKEDVFEESLNTVRTSMSSEPSLSSLSGLATSHRRILGCALSKKSFTYLVLNVRQWHDHIKDCGDDAVLDMHSNVLECVLVHFTSCKGVAEVFSGDRFVCSFNAARVAVGHRQHACSCALMCHTGLKRLGLTGSASAVSGEGRVGNIGNTAMRRFSFLTPVVTWGHALERFCRSCDASTVVDPVVHADVHLLLMVRLIDAVLFEKIASLPIRVFEVLGQREAVTTDEWMYQLEEAAQKDRMKPWNDCASRIVNNDFTDHATMAPTVAKAAGKAVERLRHAHTHRLFEPLGLLYH